MKSSVKRLLAVLLSITMLAGLTTGCVVGSSAAKKNASADAVASAAANVPVCEETTIKGADQYDQSQIRERAFTFGHVTADGSGHDIAGEVLSSILSQKTEGKMHVEVYNSGQLGTDASMMSDAAVGSLDFFSTNMSSFQSYIPEIAALDMPFFYNNLNEFHEYLLDNDAFFDRLSPMFEEKGFKLMPWQGIGWRQLTTNVEITGPESFRGMALRIPVIDSYIAIWKSLGAATTAINSSELFLALQQKMVDGQENPYDQVYTYGLGEVQKYITNSRHLQYFQQVIMSTETWESLNEVEQTVIWDASVEMADYVTAWAEECQDYYLELLQEQYGCTYVDFDEIPGMREALREESFEYVYDVLKMSIANHGGDPAFLDEYIEMRGFEIPA